MAELKTEITEIVTGLGMLGFPSIERALETRPKAVLNVTDEHFARLDTAYRSGDHAALFTTAWENGTIFARSTDGLRGRPPWSIEWKGSHRPPAYEQIPADLRVDHVYLISCKYGSKILTNSSPSNLFEHRLTIREGRSLDWFAEVAPDEYQDLYDLVRAEFGGLGLPATPAELSREQRNIVRKALPRRLDGELGAAYQEMNAVVAAASVQRWKAALRTKAQREELVWRLLRFQAAPYFILGMADRDTPIRIRVATPWDVRNRFDFVSFELEAGARAQAVVGWRAVFRNLNTDNHEFASGHVQIRWSHGKFGQVPEAKVYLDTPYAEVPGYFRLDRND